MRLALIGLADCQRLAQTSDRILQAIFRDRVAGLPLQPLRSLHCFIYATRHAWSSAGAPAKTHPREFGGIRHYYQPECPFFTVMNGSFVARVAKRPELADCCKTR